MCILCRVYVITKGLGGDMDMQLCKYDDSGFKLNAELLPYICGVCDGTCYNLHVVRDIAKESKHYRSLVCELTVMWVGTRYDFMFIPKPYVNRLYFHSKVTRRLRKHFRYNVRAALHCAPIVQTVTFIRCIQRYNSIAFTDELEGVFSRIFTDAMLSEETFPYPPDNGEDGMMLHYPPNGGSWFSTPLCIPRW